MKNLSFINKIIYIANSIVAMLLLLSMIFPYLPPKTFSFLSVINLGVSFLILINVFFFIYWLIRVKKQFLTSFIVLIIAYITFGSLYKFAASKNVESEQNFKVMNYNVRLFNLYEWIPGDNVEKDVASFINDEAPDILSIQEYQPNKNVDLSSFKYKFEKLSGQKFKHGQAILSKFPIVNTGSVEFPKTANNAIFADVVKGKDTIRIYNIHLESLRIDTNIESLKKEDSERLLQRIGSAFKTQQNQAELFLEHKNNCTYKMIVCGDFNNTAFSYVYRKIKGDLNDSFKEGGNGFGRTHDFKFLPMRIDFILVDEAFAVNGFKTYSEHFSDHYPISATLSLE